MSCGRYCTCHCGNSHFNYKTYVLFVDGETKCVIYKQKNPTPSCNDYDIDEKPEEERNVRMNIS